MAFRTPNFNVPCNVWRNGDDPTTDPPAFSTICNISCGERTNIAMVDMATTFFVEILLPKLTDVRGVNTSAGSDTIEAPSDTGRYYLVLFVEDVAKSYDNEYRLVISSQVAPRPVPTP